ncbi:MAG TPA: hypothetical protein VFZ09_28300 [Archangium sp.]|uniref:hypothetical protein n=1 Tax=Archangium sp. TaxID=1872627 RepID=UPI002E32723C|nr:hypothetical protein [Archangium sp.]HEX5750165.1 hypothetical protein [Archangium sp.]
MKRHVLITGASIAGPAMAWWLNRHGMAATVVERAREFRDGGQTIDVRGAGRTVVQRMGLEEAIRERTTHEEAVAFVDARNHVRARIGVEQFGGNGLVAELEILRGELARLLVEHSRDSVEPRSRRRHTPCSGGAPRGLTRVTVPPGTSADNVPKFPLALRERGYFHEGIFPRTRIRAASPGSRAGTPSPVRR